MQISKLLLMTLIAILIGACSGSDAYRGEWNATDTQGAQMEIVFGENDFSITEKGNTEKFEYTQNSFEFEGSVETYGIKLEDGRSFKIHFPIGDDESKGAILDVNDSPQYFISREGYISYQEVYGL